MHVFQKISSYIFCIVSLVDPVDALKLKLPSFLLFVLSFLFHKKINKNNIPIVGLLILCNIISYMVGDANGLKIDFSLMIHFLLFFVLLFCIVWDYCIDFLYPIITGCVILSILTIFGFFSILFFPDIEILLYQYSLDHDLIFLMSHRTFLGIDFNSFCFKSLPILAIPASFYVYQFFYQKKNKTRNFLFSLLFLFAMFCGGNRSMVLGVVFIIIFISYPIIKKKKTFRLCAYLLFVIIFLIVVQALTEKGEISNDIKYGHLTSYMTHFSEYWTFFLWGTGAGSYFYSIGFDDYTNLSEWTYIELYRMYGMIGGTLILFFLFKPLLNWNMKKQNIENWYPMSLGYVLFLIICGSNPYLINSTGLICIIFMYSYIANPKYKIEYRQ